jgi:hypothetical protein
LKTDDNLEVKKGTLSNKYFLIVLSGENLKVIP